jgi:hypothetical protein
LPKFATLFTHVLSEKLNLLTGKEFVDIVELLLDANANRDLDDLSGFVHELDNKELTRLEKAISGRLTPKGFQSAIKSHRTKLGSPYTFFDSILGRN